jgi:6-pyruvoyltetrahydropterin/6-carboxytetrahydropterin synthase
MAEHKITCTRKLQFCAGHRVRGHESKCAHLHGHNYIVFITARMQEKVQPGRVVSEVDEIGRVIDFSVLKKKLLTWIDYHWDHGFILSSEDKTLATMIETANLEPSKAEQKLYLMPYNPTAENMAKYLGSRICPQLFNGDGIEVIKVRIWETENCYADWTKE